MDAHHTLRPPRGFSLGHCHPYYHPSGCWKGQGVFTAIPLCLQISKVTLSPSRAVETGGFQG